MKKAILTYIMETYDPEALILYGSFAEGTESPHSDFDALAVAGDQPLHDAAVIDGTVLDLFVYPAETFQADYDPEDFVQVFDGKILLDRSGVAAGLKARVLAHLEQRPRKTAEEKRRDLDWCRKMLGRAERDDAEGFFRWHWLLVDSLEISFDLRDWPYYGPKKALRTLEQRDRRGFGLYEAALRTFSPETLTAWVRHLERIWKEGD